MIFPKTNYLLNPLFKCINYTKDYFIIMIVIVNHKITRETKVFVSLLMKN